MSDKGQRIFKWAVWIVLIISMTIFTCVKVNSLVNPGIMKYEWIRILNEGFGYTGYLSEEPYFSDVPKDNEYFYDVQVSADNGIINKSGAFNGDDEVTGDFVVVTLMKAIGEERLVYYTDITDFTDENLIKLSKELHIAERIKGKQSVSKDDADEALLSALDFYTSPANYPEYFEIKYNENVVEGNQVEFLSVDLSNNEIIVSSVPENLTEGKVLILTDDYGIAYAKKVSGIQQNISNATISLVDVSSLAEVAETISFSGSGDFSYIAEHSVDKALAQADKGKVSNRIICSANGRPLLLLAANPVVSAGIKDWADDVFDYDEDSAVNVDDRILSTDIEITFEIEETVKDDKLSESVVAYIKYETEGLPATTYKYACEDGQSKMTVVAETEFLTFETNNQDKDSSSDKEENTTEYANKVGASFFLEDFTINSSGYFETFDWNDEKNFFEVMINTDVKLLSSAEGTIDKKTKVGEVEVPIAQTGGIISVGVEFYAVTSVSGELELIYEVRDVHTGIRASVDDYNKTGSMISTPFSHGCETVSAVAKVELKGGAELAATVSCFKFDIVDPGVEICAVGEVGTVAQITVDEKYADCDLCVNFGVAAPVMTLEATAGEDSVLKLLLDAFELTAKAEYELITKDTAPFRIAYHVETDVDGSIIMLEGGDEVCTHAKQEELKDLIEDAERKAQEKLEQERHARIDEIKRRIEEELKKILEQWLLDNCNEC